MPSFVRYYGNHTAAGVSSVTLSSFTVTSGDTGVIGLFWTNTSSAGVRLAHSQFIDTLGNVWTVVPLSQQFNGSLPGPYQGVILVANIVTGGTASLTVNFGISIVNNAYISGFELSGTLSVVDQYASNSVASGDPTNPTGDSVTISQSNEVLIAYGMSNIATGVGSGWSNPGSTGNSKAFLMYQFGGSSGTSYTATLTTSGGNAAYSFAILSLYQSSPAATPRLSQDYGSNTGVGVTSIALANAQLTAGNLAIIAVAVTSQTGITISSVTDTLGNTWTPIPNTFQTGAGGGVKTSQMFYSKIVNGGTSTITAALSGSSTAMIGGCEFSNPPPTLDTSSSNKTASTTSPTIVATLTNPNELVISAFFGSPTSGTPLFVPNNNETMGAGAGGVGTFDGFIQFAIAPSTSWTAGVTGNSATDSWNAGIVAFGPPPPPSHFIDCDAQVKQSKSHFIDAFAKATQASHLIDADAFNPNAPHSHFIDCFPGQGRSYVLLAGKIQFPIQPGAWVKLNGTVLNPARGGVNLAGTIVAASARNFVNLAGRTQVTPRSFVKLLGTIQKGGSPSHNIDCAAAVPTRSFVNLASTILQKLSIGGCGNYPDISYVKLAGWIRDPKQSVQAPGSGLLPADDFNSALLAAGAYDQVSEVILAGIPLIVTGFTVGVISYQTRTRTWLKLVDEAPNGDFITTKVETKKLPTGQVITTTTTTEQNQDKTIVTVTTQNGNTPNLVQKKITQSSKTGQETVREVVTNTTAGVISTQETKTVFTKPPVSDNVQPLKVTTLDGILHFQFFGSANPEWAGGDVEGVTKINTQVSIQPGVLNGQSTDQFGNPILQKTTLTSEIDPTGKEIDTTVVEIGTRGDYGTTTTDTVENFNGIQTNVHKVVNYPNGSQQISDTTTNNITGDSLEQVVEIDTDIYGNVTTTTTKTETTTAPNPSVPGGFQTTKTQTVTTQINGVTTQEVTTTTDNNFEDSIVNDKIRVFLIQEFTIQCVIDWQNMDAILEYNIQHQTQYALVELFGQQLGNAQLSYALRQRLIQQLNQAANCMIPITLQALGKTYQVVFAPSASAFRAKYIPGTEPHVYELQLILQERSNLINGTRQFG